MLYHRPATERGHANLGWLNSYHTFSFGHYHDDAHMGFSVLRVINDDTVSPGAGFETHGHRNMEIISYVLDGAIEHKDSMGKQYVIPAGQVQVMSAGTGVTHSEFNASNTEPLRFLQMWIQPNAIGVTPSYQQKSVEQSEAITALVTPDGRNGSLTLHQDASIFRLQLSATEQCTFDTHQRSGYLHVIDGDLTIENETGDTIAMQSADGLGVWQEKITLTAMPPVTALWFDLPALPG